MREIKFRAWDKKLMKMFLVNKLDIPNFDSGAVMLHQHPHQDESTDTWQSLGSIELMQFTGLLDKNKKEIYEGSIVQYYDSTTMWLKSVVKDIGSCYALTTPENPIPLYDFLHEYEYKGESIPEIEVIGNIYENPELLK